MLMTEKWTPDLLVLYDWYTYIKSDFIADLISPNIPLIIDNIEYQQLKEEEFETLKFIIDT